MPHTKFIAAMLACLAGYGQLYPKDLNIKKKKYGGCEDFFWFTKVTGKHPSQLSDEQLRDYYERTNDATNFPYEDAPRPIWEHINEIDMLQQAFAGQGKKYPQFTNLWRLFGKYKQEGVKTTLDGGTQNLAEKEGEGPQSTWMMDQVIDGKPGELIGATEEWINREYSATATAKPYAALLVTGMDTQLQTESRKELEKIYGGK